jgi:hypothetical protein
VRTHVFRCRVRACMLVCVHTSVWRTYARLSVARYAPSRGPDDGESHEVDTNTSNPTELPETSPSSAADQNPAHSGVVLGTIDQTHDVGVVDLAEPMESPNEIECRRALAILRPGQIKDLCAMLGRRVEPGPLEVEEVRRRGVDALVAVLSSSSKADAAGEGVDDTSAARFAAAFGGAAGEVERRKRREQSLFESIASRDLATINSLCTADPLLIHTVRAVDGKTPTIVAAIHGFAAGVWYFVERGAAFKHHSPPAAGFNGHHVSELTPCEFALDELARLGDSVSGPSWTAPDVVARCQHAATVASALGDDDFMSNAAGVPLPCRKRCAGASYVLRQLHALVGADARQFAAGTAPDRAALQACVSARCRVLLDLALTYVDIL